MKSGQPYTAAVSFWKKPVDTALTGNRRAVLLSVAENRCLQIDFVTELFRKAQEKGIHTTLDTSANPFTTKEPFYSKWKELMQYTDLILLDIKHIDPEGTSGTDRSAKRQYPCHGAGVVRYGKTGVDPSCPCAGTKRQR